MEHLEVSGAVRHIYIYIYIYIYMCVCVCVCVIRRLKVNVLSTRIVIYHHLYLIVRIFTSYLGGIPSIHKHRKPIPVAAWSKAWVCGRSPAGIAGSNPAGGSLVSVVGCQVVAPATS